MSHMLIFILSSIPCCTYPLCTHITHNTGRTHPYTYTLLVNYPYRIHYSLILITPTYFTRSSHLASQIHIIHLLLTHFTHICYTHLPHIYSTHVFEHLIMTSLTPIRYTPIHSYTPLLHIRVTYTYHVSRTPLCAWTTINFYSLPNLLYIHIYSSHP